MLPVIQILLTKKAHNYGSNAYYPMTPLLASRFLPLRVQNFICLTFIIIKKIKIKNYNFNE